MNDLPTFLQSGWEAAQGKRAVFRISRGDSFRATCNPFRMNDLGGRGIDRFERCLRLADGVRWGSRKNPHIRPDGWQDSTLIWGPRVGVLRGTAGGDAAKPIVLFGEGSGQRLAPAEALAKFGGSGVGVAAGRGSWVRDGRSGGGGEGNGADGALAGGGGVKAGGGGLEVEQAALAGVHGGKADGPAGGYDLSDGFDDGFLELAVAVGFEAGGIEADAVVLVWWEAEELGDDVFERIEEFAAALEQKGEVGAGELEVKEVGLLCVGPRAGVGVGDGMELEGEAGRVKGLAEEGQDGGEVWGWARHGSNSFGRFD